MALASPKAECRLETSVLLDRFTVVAVNYDDFSEKTVHPVTTYAMSGLGTTPDDYARSCRGARIDTGLAVRGEEARSARADVDSWLRRTSLLDGRAHADE